MGKIRNALATLYIRIGETLGFIHLRNCHTCVHRADCSDVDLVLCDLYLKEEGVLAFADPCEAVWCDDYAEKFGEER